ncbi:hypothetical protein HMPREF1254_0375 [Prevotella sp. BV3P1]|nr:hypothetical protein HMPREF1254_0375 [Prevotella sp. BV3P1]
MACKFKQIKISQKRFISWKPFCTKTILLLIMMPQRQNLAQNQ